MGGACDPCTGKEIDVRGFGKKKILKEKERLENLGVDGKITSG